MSAGPDSTGAVSTALRAGVQLGNYVLGAPLWPLRIADAYRAQGPEGPATVYVVRAAISAVAEVRDQIVAGTRAAAALPEHRHLVRTLAAGLTGEHLWIATEELDGALVRDLLAKKRGGAGLGLRAAGNLIAGVGAALADAPHGALAPESVVVSRSGRVRVADLALGAGTAAAIAAGLVAGGSGVAPEIAAGQAPSGAADVFGLGALLYEALTGRGLERQGPRPSDVVAGATSQLDEVIARACQGDPARRFGRPDVLADLVADALLAGGDDGAGDGDGVPAAGSLPDMTATGSVPALAEEVAAVAAPTPPAAAAPTPPAATTLDGVLAAAAADPTEKWLITRDKFDYGPFTLADVLAQIDRGEILGSHVIIDKDSGARSEVGAHPLLGPIADAARQRRDDARRAQAEVVHQSREKKRGAALYVVIGLGVIAAAVAVYVVIKSTRHEEAAQLAGVSGLDGASLKVTVSAPKKPPPKARRPSGGGAAGTGDGASPSANSGGENLSLDMSGDDDDGSETLDMGTVYGVYSRYGGQLGGCLQSSGESAANIGIIIDGPSGKVTWVKVNGKQAGAAYGCLSRVLRGMKFPAIHGPRTRAEFDISL